MDKAKKVIPTVFTASIYENLVPLGNSGLSKSRCKVFYKGLNRNGSFFSAETAEQLVSTMVGMPIVGDFDGEKDDFLGHSWDREHAKAYGFIPEDNNVKWETFLDDDGVHREYICTDVVLWVGRYPIASRIVGKSQSMELNPNTIQGQWVETPNEFYYEITYAELDGLCVLGDDYEPCFEGSQFFTKINGSKTISEDLRILLETYAANKNSVQKELKGGQEMNKKDFQAETDVEKVEVAPETVELEAPAETDETEKTEVENNDVSLETTESTTEETEVKANEEAETIETEETPVKTEEETNSEEIEILNSQLAEKDSEIKRLNEELESLKAYKAEKIEEEKETILEKYSKQLTEEEQESLKGRMKEFSSATALKQEIAVLLLDKNQSEDEEESSQFALSTEMKNISPIEMILQNHVNNKK